MEKMTYVEPTLDKVVLTTNERIAACETEGSDPPGPPPNCSDAAPSFETDDPS